METGMTSLADDLRGEAKPLKVDAGTTTEGLGEGSGSRPQPAATLRPSIAAPCEGVGSGLGDGATFEASAATWHAPEGAAEKPRRSRRAGKSARFRDAGYEETTIGTPGQSLREEEAEGGGARSSREAFTSEEEHASVAWVLAEAGNCDTEELVRCIAKQTRGDEVAMIGILKQLVAAGHLDGDNLHANEGSNEAQTWRL